jgi:predicted GIY-YIG superfamily endonuclease
MNKTKKIIGVYSITCSQNGRCYIGQSSNISERLNQHKKHLESGQHINQNLLSDYNRFGASAFRFEVIEKCDSVEEARHVESKLIKERKQAGLAYNIECYPIRTPLEPVKFPSARCDSEQFANILKSLVEDHGSFSAFAKKIGLTRQEVMYVVTRQRNPTDRMLSRLGLRRVYYRISEATSLAP